MSPLTRSNQTGFDAKSASDAIEPDAPNDGGPTLDSGEPDGQGAETRRPMPKADTPPVTRPAVLAQRSPCAEGLSCYEGMCCAPSCSDAAECGSDGCGGDCGSCDDGLGCTPDQTCEIGARRRVRLRRCERRRRLHLRRRWLGI